MTKIQARENQAPKPVPLFLSPAVCNCALQVMADHVADHGVGRLPNDPLLAPLSDPLHSKMQAASAAKARTQAAKAAAEAAENKEAKVKARTQAAKAEALAALAAAEQAKAEALAALAATEQEEEEAEAQTQTAKAAAVTAENEESEVVAEALRYDYDLWMHERAVMRIHITRCGGTLLL